MAMAALWRCHHAHKKAGEYTAKKRKFSAAKQARGG
jgi:hypothetical protein